MKVTSMTPIIHIKKLLNELCLKFKSHWHFKNCDNCNPCEWQLKAINSWRLIKVGPMRCIQTINNN